MCVFVCVCVCVCARSVQMHKKVCVFKQRRTSAARGLSVIIAELDQVLGSPFLCMIGNIPDMIPH